MDLLMEQTELLAFLALVVPPLSFGLGYAFGNASKRRRRRERRTGGPRVSELLATKE